MTAQMISATEHCLSYCHFIIQLLACLNSVTIICSIDFSVCVNMTNVEHAYVCIQDLD